MEKQSDKLLEECPKCHSKNIKNVKSSRNNYHEYNSPPDPTLFDELVCMDCGHAWIYRRANPDFIQKERDKQIQEKESSIYRENMALIEKAETKSYLELESEIEKIVLDYENSHPLTNLRRENPKEAFDARWKEMLEDKTIIEKVRAVKLKIMNKLLASVKKIIPTDYINAKSYYSKQTGGYNSYESAVASINFRINEIKEANSEKLFGSSSPRDFRKE